jgi:minimal PKS acyl carrier protein
MSDKSLSYEDLATVIKECAGVTVDAEIISRRPDLSFADLGVESLGVLGIVAALENRYGIRLTGSAQECHRPEQLRDLVTREIGKESSDAGTH